MASAAKLPAPGQNPKLDAQTRVPTLVGISIGFSILTTIALILRLYTRYFVVRNFGLDDGLIVISQILSIGVSVVTILEAKYALGRHVWMTTREGIVKQQTALFAGIILYNLAQIITKTSFLFQYRRIFSEGRTRVVCFWLIILLIIWGITQEVLLALACVPLATILPSHQGKCLEVLPVWYLTSSMNIVTDFMIFTTPMPAILRLKLPWRQRALVASIFGLGFFTCIISIVRVFTLRNAISTPDPTWDHVPTSYWTVVELNCGILCACLPTLRPLLRRFFPRFFRQTEYKLPLGGNSGGGTGSKPSERRKIRGPYALATLQTLSGGDDSGAGAGAGQLEPARVAYDARYYTRPSGQMAELTTAISGGRREGTEAEEEKEGRGGNEIKWEAGPGGAKPPSPRGIRVTTGFHRKETRREKEED